MPTKQQRELFLRLVRDNASELYRFAFWQTRSTESAEDLVQETFLEAWQSIGRLNDRGRARAWILQILRHRFSHWLRSKQRRPKVGAELEMLDRRAESGSDPPRDIGSQLDLERAMGRIDDRYREAFLLVFLQGFTCREAAEILEVPIGTVLSRIHRARQVLRKQLTATPADADRFTSPPSLEVLRREENHG